MRLFSSSCVLGLVVVGLSACSDGGSAPNGATPPRRTPLTLDALARAVPAIATRAPLVAAGEGFVVAGLPPAPAAGLHLRHLDVTLPSHAGGALHLALDGASADVTALDVADARASLEDDLVRARDVAPSTEAIWLAREGVAEELRVLSAGDAPSVFRWRITPRAAIASVDVRDARIELLDGHGVLRIGSDPVIATDANGVSRALSLTVRAHDGVFDVVGSLDRSGLKYPIVVDPSFTSAPSLPKAIGRHFALPFGNGFAIYAYNDAAAFAFDAGKKTWSSAPLVASALAFAPLSSKGLFAVTTAASGGAAPLAHLDPAATAWATYPITGKSPHAGEGVNTFAVELADHRLFVQPQGPGGGFLYDPTAKSLADAGDAPTQFDGYYASFTTVAPSGNVVGIERDCASATQGGLRAYVYASPVYGASTSSAPSGTASCIGHDAVLLSDGRILATGGFPLAGTTEIADAWLFDPAKGTWTAAAPMGTPRLGHALVVLPDGKHVLAIGGRHSSLLASTEIYDVAKDAWTAGPSLAQGRMDVRAFVVGATVYVTGGETGNVSSPQATTAVEALEVDAPGTACSGDTCAFGLACVDGVCCTSASCPTGSSCNASPSTAGTCTKTSQGLPNGAPATNASDCASGFAADGVCCDGACNGQCEACDVPAYVGSCVAVTGAPHGSRSACPPATDGDACKALACDGKNTDTCAGFPGASVACGTSSCSGGMETPPGSCDGAGSCVAGTAFACAPYQCGADACKTSCAVDTDCTSGFCVSGACTGGTTNDGGVVNDAGADCDADGTCGSPGGDGGSSSSGGCSTSSRVAPSAFAILLALGAFAFARRRT